jgi:mannan polymerase II complex MNN10 subunit
MYGLSMVCSQHIGFSGAYSDGDFMIHFAGLDDKKGWTNKIVGDIETLR